MTRIGRRDRNGVELATGDLVLVGMRHSSDDFRGWTMERIALDQLGAPMFVDPHTNEGMIFQHDSSLILKLTPELESLWRLSDGKLTWTCPVDDRKCPHACMFNSSKPDYCHRVERGWVERE